MYQEGLIKSAITQVFYRTERYNPNSGLELLEELRIFLLNNIQYILILAIIMVIVRFMTIHNIQIKLQNRSEYIKESLPFFMISMMPFVWYIVLANHTLLHPRFVYRHMLIFLCGILICIKKLFVINKKEKSQK